MLRCINAGRRPTGHRPGGAPGQVPRVESILERRYGVSRRLAVYGSLIPGQENAHLLTGVAGSWICGRVRGHLLDRGWASGRGYPGLRWDPGGASVPVHLLTSSDLPNHWSRLDDFEGDEYLRILVPVEGDDGRIRVANLYALRT